MPRVSEQYLTERRAEILEAARRCFVRDGFHATSMQDLFREADLSAGAVYRYFASKDEMIIAIAEDNMRDVAEMMHAMATSSTPETLGDALSRVLELVRQRHEEQQIGALAIQVWAEASRNPDLRERFVAVLAETRAAVAEIVRAHQAAGDLPAGVEAAALAAVFTTIVPGYLLQLSLLGPQAVEGVPDAIRALWPSRDA